MLFFHGKVTRIQSLCEDVMFTATSGRKKPKKLLMLGISMKNLTGSRKVIEILNRFGHCISYHAVEKLN